MPKFPVPNGFMLPEGTLEGEDFQLVVKAKVEDGMMEISEVEGISIEGYEDPEKEVTAEPDEDEGEAEEEMVEGETAGDRFTKKFRGKVTAY